MGEGEGARRLLSSVGASLGMHAKRVLKSKTASGGSDDWQDVPWYSSTSPFMMPFWAVLGAIEVEKFESVRYGAPIMWLFTLLATVVLVNLLVAMFADTYTRIKERADVEYRYLRYLYVYLYGHLQHPLPPPLSLPFLLRNFGRAVNEDDQMPEKAEHWSSVISPTNGSLADAYHHRFILKSQQHDAAMEGGGKSYDS